MFENGPLHSNEQSVQRDRSKATHDVVGSRCRNRYRAGIRQPVIGHSAVRARLLSRSGSVTVGVAELGILASNAAQRGGIGRDDLGGGQVNQAAKRWTRKLMSRGSTMPFPRAPEWTCDSMEELSSFELLGSRVFTQPGSKAEVAASSRHVRFSTKSRHLREEIKCRLCARCRSRDWAARVRDARTEVTNSQSFEASEILRTRRRPRIQT